jgi:hypothetical protein
MSPASRNYRNALLVSKILAANIPSHGAAFYVLMRAKKKGMA